MIEQEGAVWIIIIWNIINMSIGKVNKHVYVCGLASVVMFGAFGVCRPFFLITIALSYLIKKIILSRSYHCFYIEIPTLMLLNVIYEHIIL